MADKRKLELEYIVKASPRILFNSLSTPSGLSGWFCDDVNIRGKIYTFIWGDTEQRAVLLKMNENDVISFRWEDDPDDAYFEFRVEKDDITSDVILKIVDFIDDDEEEEEARLLWDSQINDLKQMIGSS